VIVSVGSFCWYAGHHVSVMVFYCVCRDSSGCVVDCPLFEAMLCFMVSSSLGLILPSVEILMYISVPTNVVLLELYLKFIKCRC